MKRFVIERLNKCSRWSELSFLSSVNTLVRMQYGPVALLISRVERICLISSLSVGDRKRELGISFVRGISVIFIWIFYFSLGFLLIVLKYLLKIFAILFGLSIVSFWKVSKVGVIDHELLIEIALFMPFQVFLILFKLLSKCLV